MKLKIACITSDHPRHKYYLNRIVNEFEIDRVIIEHREPNKPICPSGTSKHDENNWIKHFDNREKTEQRYFRNQKDVGIKTLNVDRKSLNLKASADFLNEIKPDMVLIYGCQLLKTPFYSSLPKESINMHLGISPRFKGVAGLFWPFYMLEPNNAGATFHYIVERPDSGSMIHQLKPKLEKQDGIHDTSCKLIIRCVDDLIKLVKLYQEKKSWHSKQQDGTIRDQRIQI